MRYFAMIEGERKGPYELTELPEAGIGPDTYVWCKGMADWEKAEDVADICRFYRQRLFDMMHGESPGPESGAAPAAADGADPYAGVPLRFRQMMRNAGADPEAFSNTQEEPDYDRPPMPTVFLSVMMTILCFPITGFVAIYYSFKARQTWIESQRSETGNNKELYSQTERRELRRKAHDYERLAKMWLGITFFVTIILAALLGTRLF